VSEARLEHDGAGRLSVSGPMDFDTVPALYAALPADLRGRAFDVDLSAVTRADTAGMGFLLELLRLGGERGVRFVNIPDQLRAIIRVNGLEESIGA